MAQKIPKADLEKVMQDAGVGARSRKKMHEANGSDETTEATPSKQSSPRGHGPATPHKASISEI